MNRATIVIPSYNGADRCRYMLESIKRNDPAVFDRSILIVEDYFQRARDEKERQEVSSAYDMLEFDFPCQVFHLNEWSNMHGAAKKAFEIAFRWNDPDWVIYLGDDLAVTKGALSNLLHFVERNDFTHIGLVQPAYWNAGEIAHSTSEREECVFFSHEKNFYASHEWTDRVKRNPHWDNVWREHVPEHRWNEEPLPGIAVPYINVNGCGFAAHAQTYRDVGGFAEGTWCLDESLSYHVWTRSLRGCVCLPGPPLVHYFGASTNARAVDHDLYTEARWIEAMGCTKAEASTTLREKMAERKDAIIEEMKRANYWKGNGMRIWRHYDPPGTHPISLKV